MMAVTEGWSYGLTLNLPFINVLSETRLGLESGLCFAESEDMCL